MRIGTLAIEPPVLLAPMAGVTDSAFRALARRLGCPAVVTEMVSAEGLVRGGRGTIELLAFEPIEHPLFVQLFGHEPEVVAEAARLCAARGFDAIDLNMGCPVRKIVKGGAGVALMRDAKRAEAILAAVRRSVSLPVSAKLRSGWSPSEINVVEVARRLAGAGADAVIVHPRTRNQFYGGSADWSLIGEVVRALTVPVIGNGDIRIPGDATRMRMQTGCAGVMVGRAALGDPWLPAALAGAPYPPTPGERLRGFAEHLERMMACLGSEHRAVQRMRKHLVWYSRGLPGAAMVRRRLSHLKTAADLTEALRSLLEGSTKELLSSGPATERVSDGSQPT